MDTARAKKKTEGTTSFASFPAVLFRFKVELGTEQQAGRIWLENKTSKQQWECEVPEVTKFAPDGIVIPRDIVLSFTAASLKEQTSQDSTNMACAALRVQSDTENPCLVVVLPLGFPAITQTVTYAFPMTPRVVDRVEVLAAQVRDIQEIVEALEQTARIRGGLDEAAIGQNKLGTLNIRVHRLDCSIEDKNKSKLYSVTFSIGDEARRTRFVAHGARIEEVLSFDVPKTLISEDVGIDVLQLTRKKPLVSTKQTLTDFQQGFVERKMTFTFGPKCSPNIIQLYFSVKWTPMGS